MFHFVRNYILRCTQLFEFPLWMTESSLALYFLHSSCQGFYCSCCSDLGYYNNYIIISYCSTLNFPNEKSMLYIFSNAFFSIFLSTLFSCLFMFCPLYFFKHWVLVLCITRIKVFFFPLWDLQILSPQLYFIFSLSYSFIHKAEIFDFIKSINN